VPQSYATYGRRVAGYLLDLLIVWLAPLILGAIGLGLLFSDAARALGIVIIVVALLWVPVVGITNQVIRQGRSGQTFGKARVGTYLLRERTGTPIGVGYALLRAFLGWLLGSVTGGIFTIVDLLFPAFNDKRQRVVDKMLQTVVVSRSPAASPAAAPATAPRELPPPTANPYA
jgi:uncharacterized RDD family membrane protein YckC